MFPADKKRVESALSAAKLPKGKVRELIGLIVWIFSFHRLGYAFMYNNDIINYVTFMMSRVV